MNILTQIGDLICIPFAWVLRTVYNFSGSYILALFAFAIVMKLVLMPFAIKQQKNMIRQAKMRPKEMAIKKKYAGRTDTATQQKQQQEIMDMYQKEGYSPLSGCAPLLIQMPIIMVLYQIIRNPLTHISGLAAGTIGQLANFFGLKAAEQMQIASHIATTVAGNGGEGFKFTLQGLMDAIPDIFTNGSINFNVPNFVEWGLDLGKTPGFAAGQLILLIIPVLTFVSQFFSMRLTKKFSGQTVDPAMGASGKFMDYTMPLISVWFTFMFQAAIGVYWIMQSALAILQSYILYRIMPIPECTEEDVKAAELEIKEKSGKKKSSTTSVMNVTAYRADGTPIKSLHRIDDEDEIPEIDPALRHAETESDDSEEANPDIPKLKEDKNSKDSYKKK